MTEIQQRPPRTLGPIHDPFWVSCDKGELRIQQCSDCGHYTWPAVAACEACGSEGLVWQAMSGRGRLVSWCSFERDYYGGMLPMPWDTILVELEEGPLFLSNPHGFSCEQAQMGMPLRVAFISCSDRNGTFKLPVFERA